MVCGNFRTGPCNHDCRSLIRWRTRPKTFDLLPARKVPPCTMGIKCNRYRAPQASDVCRSPLQWSTLCSARPQNQFFHSQQGYTYKCELLHGIISGSRAPIFCINKIRGLRSRCQQRYARRWWHLRRHGRHVQDAICKLAQHVWVPAETRGF